MKVTVKREHLDGGWIASCPGMPGCMSQGETELETLENFVDAARGWIAAHQTGSLPVGE